MDFTHPYIDASTRMTKSGSARGLGKIQQYETWCLDGGKSYKRPFWDHASLRSLLRSQKRTRQNKRERASIIVIKMDLRTPQTHSVYMYLCPLMYVRLLRLKSNRENIRRSVSCIAIRTHYAHVTYVRVRARAARTLHWLRKRKSYKKILCSVCAQNIE